jgi:ribonucleoside-diphosphate reductase alpha chain
MKDVQEFDTLSDYVWNEKYRFRLADGTIIDQSLEDTYARVAGAVASCEDDQRLWETRFFHILNDQTFLPGGRIMAGAGTGRDVTLYNCYVMGTIEDSMSGIMKALAESSLTLKQGGGIGMDFSTLRPRGAVVRGVESTSSGAVSFMGLWNEMCGTIMSAGARRGAMMAVLRCDHPDVLEFIEAKQKPGVLTNFNVSVGVTREFMEAVRDDRPWALHFQNEHYKTIPARDLWDKILKSTHEFSEPGVIFIDRVNDDNVLNSIEIIAATNPCGEQALPPYGACLLGSLNLAKLVLEPFTDKARVDMQELTRVAGLAVRFLDNVIDVSNYPLPEQEREAKQKRRMGLGITGLGNALIMLGVPYGSSEGRTIAAHIMRQVKMAAWNASDAIATAKGPFPLWTEDLGPCRRNSHLTSIQPVGTMSAFAGNISSGIEPVFSYGGARRVLQADGSHRTIDVKDYAAELYGKEPPKDDPVWATAMQISPTDHVKMVAALQPFVDSAISKTINCPEEISFDDLASVYDDAYDGGCKGCTTYRPSPIRGAVLIADVDKAPETPAEPSQSSDNVIQLRAPISREAALPGTTYKLKPAGHDHALYVTINDLIVDGRRRPFEIFFNSKAVDGYQWMTALSRTISAVLRQSNDASFLVEELRAIHDPRGGFWHGKAYVPSMCALIGDTLALHMGLEDAPADAIVEPSSAVEHIPISEGRHCPKCQRGKLVRESGCESCNYCTYTKC